MIEAVVFDFDGTIVDTEVPAFASVAEMFAARSYVLDRDRWVSHIGTRVDAFDDALTLLADITGESYDGLYAHAVNRHRDLTERASARPGVLELVAECREHGILLAVATSASRRWVEPHLARLGVLDAFSTIVPAEEVGNHKPHPEPYLTACVRLGVSPERCVAIEDSPTGVQSAAAAGLFTLGVPGPLTVHLDLDGAHVWLESLAAVTVAWLARTLAER